MDIDECVFRISKSKPDTDILFLPTVYKKTDIISDIFKKWKRISNPFDYAYFISATYQDQGETKKIEGLFKITNIEDYKNENDDLNIETHHFQPILKIGTKLVSDDSTMYEINSDQLISLVFVVPS